MKDTLKGCGTALQNTVHVSRPQLVCAAVFPKARIRVSGKQGVEVDSGPLAIISELPCWLSGKESAYRAGDEGSILGLRRSPEEGNGYPLQYSCLGNSVDRGAWWLQFMGSHKSQT